MPTCRAGAPPRWLQQAPRSLGGSDSILSLHARRVVEIYCQVVDQEARAGRIGQPAASQRRSRQLASVSAARARRSKNTNKTVG